jgi:hypothetical protein
LHGSRRVPFFGLLVFWFESIFLGLAQHFSGHPVLRIALNLRLGDRPKSHTLRQSKP